MCNVRNHFTDLFLLSKMLNKGDNLSPTLFKVDRFGCYNKLYAIPAQYTHEITT